MKWRVVDEQERQKRSYLTEDHSVYYLREYKIMGGYQHGETNDLILNFQKGVDCSPGELPYRKKAIEKFGDELRNLLQGTTKTKCLISGMPPHHPPTHKLFDDRIELSIKHAINGLTNYSHQRLLENSSIRSELKNSGNRTPDYLRKYLTINNVSISDKTPIIIVDDTLISGSSINAVQSILNERFNNNIYFIVWAKGVY